MMSYFHHRGFLSSRCHTHTFRHQGDLRYNAHVYMHILQREAENHSEPGGTFISSGGHGERTLIAVDSISAALTRFAGSSIETFITLTNSGSVNSIQTQSITEAGLSTGPRARFTVLTEEPSAAPLNLNTEWTCD